MPTTGAYHEAARLSGRLRHYERGRERARALLTPLARERRAAARSIAAELRQDILSRRREAREEQRALRADPAYGLYRTWEGRMERGTLYDAEQWRKGRLVAVSERTRYRGGVRREVVDWTDILDREAQQAGLDVRDLPTHFERLRRGERRIREQLREVDKESAELQDYRRAELGAA